MANPPAPTEDPTANRDNAAGSTGDIDTNDGGVTGDPAAEPNTGDNQAQDDNSQTSNVADLGEIVVTAKRPTKSTDNGTITPMPNVLDEYASYTYQASVYLMTPAQLKTFQLSEKKSVSGYNLLFQSAGGPNNVGGPQGAAASTTGYATVTKDGVDTIINASDAVPGSGSPDAGRNPFFPNDFYIDAITISNTPMGKGSMAAHGVTQLKFTVIEPANITLLDCMYKAVQDMQPRAGEVINYAAACYLMVIRFYGYDINGLQSKVSPMGDPTGQTDPSAVIEKYIPFRIKDINWEVSSKLVSYEFDCVPIGQSIAGSTRRATIPADFELSGQTVGELLCGSVAANNATAAGQGNRADENQSDAETARLARQNAAAAPPNASAAQQKTSARLGLVGAMNAEQQRLVKSGQYTVADEYEIVFAKGAEKIRDATITKPGGDVNKGATNMGPAPQQNPSGMSPDKGSMNVNSRNQGITAGMQMAQVIELAIRNSNYITYQATTTFAEGDEDESEQGSTKENATFTSHNIIMSAQQLDYDPKRRDFAYRVRYTIIPFTPTDFQSQYFPLPKFRGVVKSYPFWFTGANTAVLDYKANFNKNYTLTVTGSSVETSLLAQNRRAYVQSMRDIPFIQHQARSTESGQGAEGLANDLAANAAEYLYNPASNGEGEISIVGDPAWIQQGSVAGQLDPKNINYKPFAADGTINFDSLDCLFEIVWQKPEDYDLTSGLADPYSRTAAIFNDRQPRQSVIYRMTNVTSEFRQGRFQQKLKGVLYLYPVKGQQTSAANKDFSGAAGTGNTGTDDSGRQNTASDPRIAGRSNQTLSTQIRTGVNLTNATAGAGRGVIGTAGGAILAPMSNTTATPTRSGQFAAAATTPADTVSAAPPADPVSSNGEIATGATTEPAQAEVATNESPQLISRDY